MSRKKKKKRRFLDLPEYPGGKKAFKEYIKKNLRYPQEALKNNIEGTVYLTFRVDQEGNVLNVNVTKGIGYGCDEEAIRLISSMKYGEANNRGIRVTSRIKARVKFELPKTKIHYEYKEKQASEKKTKTTYNYTINLFTTHFSVFCLFLKFLI